MNPVITQTHVVPAWFPVLDQAREDPLLAVRDGWEAIAGPIRCIGGPGRPNVVTVLDRVLHARQRFDTLLGTAVVVGFERHVAEGYVQVVVANDHPDYKDEVVARWDMDRTVRAQGRWNAEETVAEAITRHLTFRNHESGRFTAPGTA